jgi:hypothetical protein
MSHKAFLDSLNSDDGRKWLIEERNGEAHYIEIIPQPKNPWATDQLGPQAKKDLKVRRLMHKKVQATAKPYAWRLGYNICSGQYTGGMDVPVLSGSSFNRKPAKKYPAKKSAEDPVHVMSKRTKGKIRDKATAFFRASKQRIFITLTFIEHVDDREGKRILNKFLTVIRKEVKGFEYLVVAEHQPERETHTIHFHLLTNRRVTIQRYNALWTLQQYNAGLTGHRKSGESISKSEIISRYAAGTVGDVLNPVQVEPAYCISGLAAYLTKYVTKQETGEKFGCLTWHCSRKVSRLFTSQLVGPSALAFLLSFRNYKLDRKTGECWAPKQMHGAFFSLVFVNNRPAVLDNLKMMEQVNNWIIEKLKPDGKITIDSDQYRRIFIGKEMKFDPIGVVGEVMSKSKSAILNQTTRERSNSTIKPKIK